MHMGLLRLFKYQSFATIVSYCPAYHLTVPVMLP